MISLGGARSRQVAAFMGLQHILDKPDIHGGQKNNGKKTI